MLDIKLCTQLILDNKVNNNFPTNDINHEFDLLKKEIIEVEEVLNEPEKLSDELADVVIFIMSIARISNINLENAIINKIEYNKNRTYKKGTFRLNN